jgi:cytoskeletal protein RodZ
MTSLLNFKPRAAFAADAAAIETLAPPVEQGQFADRATLGEFLRNHRESRKTTLQQVAHDTKIPSKHLSALERGDIRHWPRGIYRRAMVRAYARAVGLDPQEMVAEFLKVFPEADHMDGELATPAQQRGSHKPPLRVVHPLAAARELSGDPVHTSTPAAEAGLAPSTKTRAAIAIVAVLGVLLAALAWYAVSGAQIAEPVAQASAQERPGGVRAELAGRSVAPPAAVGTDVARTGAALPDSAVATATQNPGSAADVRQAAPEGVTTADDEASATRPVTATSSGLVITSNPAGARVTVDGIGWGETPVTIRHLPAGSKVVRITKDGYQATQRTVDLAAADASRSLRVTLQPQAIQ